jgi:hypothetical protein
MSCAKFTGNHRDLHRLGRPANQFQILTWAHVVIADVREVRERLSVAVGPPSNEVLEGGCVVADLLLEQREQHHCRRAAVLQTADAIELLRQR